MATKSKNTITNRITTDNERIAGAQKYCTQPSVLVDGSPYTLPQIVAVYQADIDAQSKVTSAELALAEARTAAKAASSARNSFDKSFVVTVRATYGSSPTVLGTFGIAVATPKAPSTEVKAAAAAQAVATRKLRGTTSKAAKAKIQAPQEVASFAPAATPVAPTTPVVAGTPVAKS
jgi:hypothetical protein